MTMVNNFVQERQAIQMRFANLFNTEEIPVQYDNVQFLKQGDRIIQNENNLAVWARLSILNLDATQQEVGNTRTRVQGTIVLNIFAKENTGVEQLRAIADSAFPIFNGQLFNGIQCRNTAVNQVPANNGWFQMNLITDYYWDRCFA